MELEPTCTAVSKVGFQALRHAAECQLIPWDVFFTEQSSLEAFGACCEAGIDQLPTIKQVYLIDVRDVYQREQSVDFYPGTGFLKCFAQSGLSGRLSVLHESGRECPESVAWLNGATAQQDVAFPFGYAADNKLRVLVVDRLAVPAYMSRQCVAFRDAEFNG